MYDLIIVGGGPAGLTAAVYALRKRLDVLLVTRDLGGKTNYRLSLPWIEDYQVIRGLEVVNRFRDELEYLDFASHMEPVEKIERRGDGFVVTKRGGGALETRAVLLATGARMQKLNVPGEREFIMRGLCYSAVSYAPLFIDRQAAVVGSGELALRAAAELGRLAQRVHLVRLDNEPLHTPLSEKLRAAANVNWLDGCQVIEVKGDKYARTLVVRTAQGDVQELETDGIFIEMALLPNSQSVAGLVDLDDQGRVMIDIHNRTSQPGIFAAGDVTNTYAEQVLVAVGQGAQAVLSAYDYLLPNI